MLRHALPSTFSGCGPAPPRRGASGISRLALCLLVLVVTVSACSRSRASGVVAGPPLAVPEPPPRVLAPLEEEPLAAAPGRTETPLATAPEVVQERATVPPEPRPTPPRQQPPAAATGTAPPVTTPPANTPQLRVESAANDETLRKETEAFIESARRDLNRIGRNASAQTLDQVKEVEGLIALARKGLSERNFTFAHFQARKAADIAASIAGR